MGKSQARLYLWSVRDALRVYHFTPFRRHGGLVENACLEDGQLSLQRHNCATARRCWLMAQTRLYMRARAQHASTFVNQQVERPQRWSRGSDSWSATTNFSVRNA